jgi:polysaccharide biosynthesis transport protein
VDQKYDVRLPTESVNRVTARLPVRMDGLSEGEVGFSGEQLREYYKVVIRYRTVIAAVTLTFALLSLVYVFTATPRYTASSTLRISTYEPVLLATNIEQMLQQKSQDTAYLETQIQEIKSLSVADKVLEDTAILDSVTRKGKQGFFSKLFAKEKSDLDEGAVGDGVTDYKHSVRDIKNYLDALQVKPLRRTSLVVIESTHESPRMAALMANKHASAYIGWVREVRVRQQSQGMLFLQQQATDLRTKLSDLEREMADYAEENSIIALNKDENIVVQSMASLNRLHTEATAKRIEAENLHKEALASLKSGSAGFDDGSLQTMRSELARLQAEHSQLSAKFTGSYPRMQQLRSQIKGLQSSLAAHQEQVVLGLKAKAAAAAAEERSIAEQLEQQKSKAFELSKKQVNYNILHREAESTRELLQNVLRQIKETGVAVESNASNVSVVDYAAAPLSPSFPRKKLVVLVCSLLGAGLGLMLAFLFNHLDNTLSTPEQVVEIIKLPHLGVVPSFSVDNVIDGRAAPAPPKAKEPAASPDAGSSEAADALPGAAVASRDLIKSAAPGEIVFYKNPRALISEAYRTIRTGILLSQAGEPPRTLLVSSAQSSEGKTTLCVNLAASLASAGGRVVLIDADLRRPTVWRYFKIPHEAPGLVEVVTGLAKLEEVLVSDAVRRISVIPSGRIPPNPAELLGSLEMVRLLDDLSGQYDYVLLDSPPILPVTDSVILSRYVDGVVLVVKGGHTPRQVVIDAKGRLQDVGARLLGVVLNDIDITRNTYDYYSRYYYSYYRQEGAEPTIEPGWLHRGSKGKRAERA